MQERPASPTKKKIADYWCENSEYEETELNFDWADAEDVCWNCGGKETVRTQRCHIVPYSLGGSNHPSNFVLLCSECHKESPDVLCSKEMWSWIRSNYIPGLFYDTYKTTRAIQMYEVNHGPFNCDKMKKIAYSVGAKNSLKVWEEVYEKRAAMASTHGPFLSISTIYWVLRESKIDFINKFNVKHHD